MIMTTTTTTTFLWAFLHNLGTFALIFVPTVAFYLVVAQVSLKVWIAAQSTPRLLPNTSEGLEQETRAHKRFVDRVRRLLRICSSFSGIPFIESALLYIFLSAAWLVDYFVKAEASTKKLALYGILVLPGIFSITRLPFRTQTLVVARTEKGAPFYIQLKKKESWVVFLSKISIGFGISTVALLDGSVVFVRRLCEAVLYGAILHIFLLGSVTSAAKEQRLRTRIIWALIWGVTLTAGVAALVIFAEVRLGSASFPAEAQYETLVRDTRSGLNVFEKYSVVYQASSWYWSCYCFQVIALCYKMDYALALEREQLTAPVVLRRPTTGTNSEATNKKKTILTQVLATFKLTFDKTYFNAAMAGFVSSAMFWVILTTVLDVFGTSIIGYEWVPYFLSSLALPVICLFIMTLAYRRGELRKVWGYGERWMDVPEDVPFVNANTEVAKYTPGIEFCEKKEIPEIEDKEQIV